MLFFSLVSLPYSNKSKDGGRFSSDDVFVPGLCLFGLPGDILLGIAVRGFGGLCSGDNDGLHRGEVLVAGNLRVPAGLLALESLFVVHIKVASVYRDNAMACSADSDNSIPIILDSNRFCHWVRSQQGCCIFIIVPLSLRSFTPHPDAFFCRASTNLCLCGFSVLFLRFFFALPFSPTLVYLIRLLGCL